MYLLRCDEAHSPPVHSHPVRNLSHTIINKSQSQADHGYHLCRPTNRPIYRSCKLTAFYSHEHTSSTKECLGVFVSPTHRMESELFDWRGLLGRLCVLRGLGAGGLLATRVGVLPGRCTALVRRLRGGRPAVGALLNGRLRPAAARCFRSCAHGRGTSYSL